MWIIEYGCCCFLLPLAEPQLELRGFDDNIEFIIGRLLFSLSTNAIQRCINHLCVCDLYLQKEKAGSVKSLPQQNVDSDIWVPDYLSPSWVCLPNNQPVLAIIQPGDTALEVLSTVCKVGRH